MTSEPTRTSQGSLALISADAEGQRLWLGQWNGGWQAISFVGGHREHGESYRECMVREVAEELTLSVTDDFHVPFLPKELVEYTAWSERAREWTRYLLALFSVELTAGVVDRLQEDPHNYWLDEQEITAGMTENKVAVSPTMKRVFDKAGLWTKQVLSDSEIEKHE